MAGKLLVFTVSPLPTKNKNSPKTPHLIYLLCVCMYYVLHYAFFRLCHSVCALSECTMCHHPQQTILNTNSVFQDQMLLFGCTFAIDLITVQQETENKIVLSMTACCPLTPACFTRFLLYKSTFCG